MRSTILLYGLATLHLAASLPVAARDPTLRSLPHPRLPKTNHKVTDSTSEGGRTVDAAINSDNSISAREIHTPIPILDHLIDYLGKDEIVDTSKGDTTLDTTINSDSSISTRDPQGGLGSALSSLSSFGGFGQGSSGGLSSILSGLRGFGKGGGSGGLSDILRGEGLAHISPIIQESEQSMDSDVTSDHPLRESARDPEPGLLDSLTPPKAHAEHTVFSLDNHGIGQGSNDDGTSGGMVKVTRDLMNDGVDDSIQAEVDLDDEDIIHADAPSMNTPGALGEGISFGAVAFTAGDRIVYAVNTPSKRVDSTLQLNSEATAEAAEADKVTGSADAEVPGNADAHASASITVTSRDSNSEKKHKGGLLGGILVPGIL